MFNFCVSLGLPYTLKTCLVDPGSTILVESKRLEKPLFFMTIALTTMLLGSMISSWNLSKPAGWLQLVLYAVFLSYFFAMEATN
jgi:Ca2+/Na+ antiporter